MSKEIKEDINVRVRKAAFDGDLEEVKNLVKLGASIDVALIGATHTKPHKQAVKWWCLENGASALWAIDHNPPRKITCGSLT